MAREPRIDVTRPELAGPAQMAREPRVAGATAELQMAREPRVDGAPAELQMAREPRIEMTTAEVQHLMLSLMAKVRLITTTTKLPHKSNVNRKNSSLLKSIQ
jgi:hypothetical protein